MALHKENIDTGGILFTGDWHCGLNSWGVNRTDELSSVFEEIIAHVKRLKPMVIVINGDITDSFRYPGVEVISQTAKVLFELSELVPHIVMVKGNHDWTGLNVFNSFAPDKIEFIQSPCIRNYTMKTNKKCSVAFVPYLKAHELPDGGYDEVMQKLRTESEIYPIYAAVHAPYINTVPMIREAVVSQKAAEGYNAVVLGHIHTHRNIEADVFYSGSLIRCSFGEENEHSGLWYIDNENNITDIILNTPYKLRTLTLDSPTMSLEDIKEEILHFENNASAPVYLKIILPEYNTMIDSVNYAAASLKESGLLNKCIVTGIHDKKAISMEIKGEAVKENKRESDCSQIPDCSDMSVKELWESFCLLKRNEDSTNVSEETMNVIKLGHALLTEENMDILWTQIKNKDNASRMYEKITQENTSSGYPASKSEINIQRHKDTSEKKNQEMELLSKFCKRAADISREPEPAMSAQSSLFCDSDLESFDLNL